MVSTSARRSLRLQEVVTKMVTATIPEEDEESLPPTKMKTEAAIPVTPSPKKKRKKPSSSPPTTPRASAAADSKNTISVPGLTAQGVAAVNPSQPWMDLKVPPEELRPSATLTTGQSFHWKAVVDKSPKAQQFSSAWGSHDATEWVGTLRISPTESVVVAIRETPVTTLYRPLTEECTTTDLKDFLYNYFQLEHSMKELYHSWSKEDARLATIAECIPGVRILDQDPWECLISFICSSNNNIPRITKMLSAIRREYGRPLVTIDQETFYSFPSCDDLAAKATDEDFRKACGLGYRSKYMLETIKLLNEYGGESYLQELREIQGDPELVQTKLCEFCGVGRKVADCVALFSLKQYQAIPVDVHVWNIALRDYDPDNVLAQIKSITPTTYRQVGDVFRSRFTEKAGWAHSLLFVAELPSFRPVLPQHILKEMDQFRKEEQLKKQEAKKAKKKAKVDK